MKSGALRLEWIVLLYFLSYTPYAVCTKLLTAVVDPSLGRPLTGLEILPFGLIVSSVFIALFLWLSGWWRIVPHRMVMGLPVFSIRGPLWVAGIGAAMLLVTVPLSYTFPNISIPTVQLLMRGDVLILAPIVDLMAGRRVRWYSWAALFLVAIGLVATLGVRESFDFPALLIFVVVVYTIGYFLRLAVMTHVAKNDDPGAMKLYFVEERLVSIPVSIGALALIAIFSDSAQGRELAWGFTQAWTSPALPYLLVIAVALFLVTFFAAMVLLDRHENSYCVPLERSASILAGLAAAFILASVFGLKWPTPVELFGAALLVVAICILTIAPRWSRGNRAAATEALEQ